MLLRKSKNGNIEINMVPFYAAGVKYNNDPDDGGASRQQILATLPGIFEVDLYPTAYNGAFAIKLKDRRTHQVIGWVPKKNLPQFTGMTRTCRATAIVCQNKDKTGLAVYIREQVPVNPQMYQFVKNWCQINNMQLPAYDEQSYTMAYNWICAQTAQPARA